MPSNLSFLSDRRRPLTELRTACYALCKKCPCATIDETRHDLEKDSPDRLRCQRLDLPLAIDPISGDVTHYEYILSGGEPIYTRSAHPVYRLVFGTKDCPHTGALSKDVQNEEPSVREKLLLEARTICKNCAYHDPVRTFFLGENTPTDWCTHASSKKGERRERCKDINIKGECRFYRPRLRVVPRNIG